MEYTDDMKTDNNFCQIIYFSCIDQTKREAALTGFPKRREGPATIGLVGGLLPYP